LARRVTILLVEDDADVRGVLSLMLEGPDRHVVVAANAAEALELASYIAIDVFLVDIVLPGIGGPDLVEQLLGLRPTARVLFMSGWYDHPQFPDVGRDVLQKPFTREQLNTALDDLLRDA